MERPVTIVTGAGSGIGRATAVLLAERGHALTLVGRTEGKLHETAALCGAAGAAAIVLACDLADRDAAHEAVDRTIAERGHLDTLVGCAGSAPQIGRAHV